jgi:hypothetical protein
MVRRHPSLQRLRPALLLLACLAVHAYCLTFILQRYF